MGKNIIVDFKETETSDPPLQRPLSLSPPPPHETFKINVDGASANDGSNSSIRVIIRDDKGHPIAALSKVLQAHYLAKVVEMLALEQGVLLAQEMALSQFIFESDALKVI